MSDPTVVRQVLCPTVLDAALFDRLATDAKSDAVKARLKAATDEAVARGAFGAPNIFVRRADESEPTMYFGADRFHLVARQLGVSMPAAFPKVPARL